MELFICKVTTVEYHVGTRSEMKTRWVSQNRFFRYLKGVLRISSQTNN